MLNRTNPIVMFPKQCYLLVRHLQRNAVLRDGRYLCFDFSNPEKQTLEFFANGGSSKSPQVLQIRQFHSRSNSGLGANEQKGNENIFPWKGLIMRIKSSKNAAYEEYKNDIEKLDEKARRSYNEGFIKAVLLGTQKDPNKNSNRLVKIVIWASVIYLGIQLYKITGGKVAIDFGISDMFNMEQEVDVTFDDVRGIDEAKLEIEEIVEYLRNPERFTRLGARLPKGALLIGDPGTGKTLLARAVAGEASVPFFHTSGSEFDEVLVGQGARRVRDLFKKARKHAPCVVFIDEIDSVGSKRTSSTLHPYANQTINQLLAEMDGFVQNEGVIVIGATNKKDNLDPALTRPGRFDLEIHVKKPDLAGRKEIFQLYLDKVIHSADCDVNKLARGSVGFTGADIENMVNQAALKAATERAARVAMRHLDEARDRLLMGPARLKGLHQDEEANRNTAFHEAGHTIVAMFTKHADPIYKVTIVPRGGSLGHTSQLPEKDQLQTTRGQMLARLDVCMGGRVAEELIFGQEMVTTGAAADMRNATEIAEKMVKMFGMSERVGLRDFTAEEEEAEFAGLGRGPSTNDNIDEEIKRVLQESYERAKQLLTKYKNEHRLLAEALLEYETLTKQEAERVIQGEKLKKSSPSLTIRQIGVKRKPKAPVGFIQETSTD